MTSTGILSYGTYVPRFRLDRKLIGEALGSGGKGTRSVAAPDEDATTMGVAAARAAMRAAPEGVAPSSLWLATTSPPYVDKTNATAVHAALALDRDTAAYDVNGAVRGAVGAVRAALGQSEPGLVVLTDLRSGMPGGADERDGGDAAAALLVGPGKPLAEVVGWHSCTEEFLDRWRGPHSAASKQWEDRFGEQVYVPLGRDALEGALKAAGATLDEVDHLVVAGVHGRSAKSLRSKLGSRARAVVDDRGTTIGNAGSAQLGVLVADALDVAAPGELVAVLVIADGADAFVLRCTDELPAWRDRRDERAVPTLDVSYATYLLWRGELRREPPRRPDPDVPVSPAAYREQAWKFAFQGARCDSCGTVHVPPQRVCASCHAVDQMSRVPVVDAVGTLLTVTADHLAFSEAPPLVAGIVDFEGGGRVQCELTDLGGRVPVRGERVEMVFRRAYTVNEIHNYVWKARPIEEAVDG